MPMVPESVAQTSNNLERLYHIPSNSFVEIGMVRAQLFDPRVGTKMPRLPHTTKSFQALGAIGADHISPGYQPKFTLQVQYLFSVRYSSLCDSEEI